MTGAVTVAVIDPDGQLQQLRVDGDAVDQLVAGLVGPQPVEAQLHSHLVVWHGHTGAVNVVATALGRTFGVRLAAPGAVVVAGGRDGDGSVRGLTGEQLAGLAAVCEFWSERASTVPATRRAARQRRRAWELKREEAAARHAANTQALLDRQKAMIRPVVEDIFRRAGTMPWLKEENKRTPEWAMGVPVWVNKRPYAVICPVAARIKTAARIHPGVIVYAASSREADRLAAVCSSRQRIVVLEPEHPPDPKPPATSAPPREQQAAPDEATP